MTWLNRRQFLQNSLMTTAATGWLTTQYVVAAPRLAPGIETKAEPRVTGEERLRQPDLWVLEVNFKPLRIITVELPDPETKQPVRRTIWYLCYRAINRSLTRRVESEIPVSSRVDELAKSSAVFVPEFLLVTDDNTGKKRYIDRVIPLAQAAINRRERHEYQNSVEVVQPIPPAATGASGDKHAIYGVATWKNVDPSTDRFTLFMTGFSNGYHVVKDPDGKEIVQRKTLMQKFYRPGDEFEENEREILPTGNPEWIYR